MTKTSPPPIGIRVSNEGFFIAGSSFAGLRGPLGGIEPWMIELDMLETAIAIAFEKEHILDPEARLRLCCALEALAQGDKTLAEMFVEPIQFPYTGDRLYLVDAMTITMREIRGRCDFEPRIGPAGLHAVLTCPIEYSPKHNPYHDPDNGQFTDGPGGGSGGGSGICVEDDLGGNAESGSGDSGGGSPGSDAGSSSGNGAGPAHEDNAGSNPGNGTGGSSENGAGSKPGNNAGSDDLKHLTSPDHDLLKRHGEVDKRQVNDFREALNKRHDLIQDLRDLFTKIFILEGGLRTDGSTVAGITTRTLRAAQAKMPELAGKTPATLTNQERISVYKWYFDEGFRDAGGSKLINNIGSTRIGAAVFDTAFRWGPLPAAKMAGAALNNIRDTIKDPAERANLGLKEPFEKIDMFGPRLESTITNVIHAGKGDNFLRELRNTRESYETGPQDAQKPGDARRMNEFF